MLRKEYNERANVEIVNPGFTLSEYESSRQCHCGEIGHHYYTYDCIPF